MEDHGGLAYTKPQQRKKEESKGLRGERDQIKFIDLRFERWQVVRFRKARRRQDKMFHKLHFLGTSNDLWDRVCGVERETWKGYARLRIFSLVSCVQCP